MGSRVWMEGSAEMRDTKREYTSSTLSTSSPTNSEYTSSVVGDWPMSKRLTTSYWGRRLKYTPPFLRSL